MRNKTYPPKATFESAWAIVQENAKAIKAMQEENAQTIRENAQAMKAMQQENAQTIKTMRQELGGISTSNGKVAESYFINSFSNCMQFAGQEYEDLSSNLKKKKKSLNLQGEFDLVLYNCTSVVIIEIKYKADKYDVDMVLKKAPIFKKLFPEYAAYDLYLGLAAFHIDEEAEEESIKQGIAVIKQVGNTMLVNDAHLNIF